MIDELKIRNYSSIKEADIKFSSGLNVIIGENRDDNCSIGAGKSSITDAAFWGLFGYSSKDLAAKSVIRWGEGNCSVVVKLKTNDTGFAILRNRTKSSTTLKLRTNKTITFRDVNAGNKHIEKLLGINKEQFLNSIFISQDSKNVLLYGTDGDRRKFLSKVFGLDLIDKAYMLSNVYYQELDASLSIFRDKLSDIEASIKSLGEIKPIDMKASIARRTDLIVARDEIQKKIDITNSAISKFNRDSSEIEKDNCGKREYIRALGNEKDKLLLEYREFKRMFAPILKSGKCNACLSDIGTSRANSIINDKVTFIKGSIKPINRQIKELEAEIRKQESISYGYMAERNKIEDERSEMGVKLDKILYELRNIDIQIAASNKNVDNLYKELRDSKDTIALKIKGLEEKFRLISTVRDIFGNRGVKNTVLTTYMPAIESYINSLIFEHMSKTKSIIFTETNQMPDLKFRTGNRTMEWKAFSGGEKKLVSFMFNIALSQYFVSKNSQLGFIIIDEPFSNLGPNSIVKAMGIINDLSKTQQVIICTNLSKVLEYAEDPLVIKAIKENDITHIEVE